MIKLIAHTTVDAFELSNEFTLRLMKRTGFLEWYLRTVLRLTDRMTRAIMSPEPSLFRDIDIDQIVKLSMDSTEGTYAMIAEGLHEAIDGGISEETKRERAARLMRTLDRSTKDIHEDIRGAAP